jgi:hypothetical protein
MSVQRHGGGRPRDGITSVSVGGFKSIATTQTIGIRPLTLLAGVNSSGKSSMLQPLLLLKQTLHSEYDPGALRIAGPNVRFTKADQMLSRIGRRRRSFTLGLSVDSRYTVEATYRAGSGPSGFAVVSTRIGDDNWSMTIKAGMGQPDITGRLDRAPRAVRELAAAHNAGWAPLPHSRSFLLAHAPLRREDRHDNDIIFAQPVGVEVIEPVVQHLREIIHVPAWRGEATRVYPATAVDRAFPGTFDHYVASVVSSWRAGADQRHRQAEEDLAALGLTSELAARLVDETQVELLVGRLTGPRGNATDLVNIADVGFGVSQCLPVVIALLVAAPGQLVYVEEPEIHLHPRAQVALAQLAVRAAKRRARVVLETHSSLLLRGIQTAVARNEIAADQVALHWFERSDTGATRVRTADLARDGSFGEWPVDFDEVALAAERDYLDAS